MAAASRRSFLNVRKPCGATHRLDVPRVELDDVVPRSGQAGDDRAVIVPGGLHPDPQRQRAPVLPSLSQPALKTEHTALVQREHQRFAEHLTTVVSDQAQRLVLANIDPRRQTPRRLEITCLLHIPLLRLTTDEPHLNLLNPGKRRPHPQ